MKNEPNGWNIVLAGAWNQAIFNPEWVAKTLFEEETVQLTLEWAVAAPALTTSVSAAGFHLSINAQRLLLSSDEIDDASLGRVEDIAVKVLGLLQHTPMAAIGLNFAFGCDLQETITTLFPTADQLLAAHESQAKLAEMSLKWQTVEVDEGLVNVTVASAPDTGCGRVSINFHQEASSAEKALLAVKGQYINASRKARAIAERLVTNARR